VSYVGVAQLRQHAQIGDSLDDAVLEGALAAATSQVNDYCRRRFDAAAGERRYERGRTRRPELPIDDAVAVEAVEVDGREWDPEWWDTYPWNAAADDQPYTAIVPRRQRRLHGRILVVGVFGWPEVPAPVHTATLLQASRLAQRRNAAFGIAQVPGLDGNSGMRLLSKLDADVELLLDPYRRRPVLAG